MFYCKVETRKVYRFGPDRELGELRCSADREYNDGERSVSYLMISRVTGFR